MAKVINIGITKKFGAMITAVPEVEVIAGQGLLGDRHCKPDNENRCQISLIESENVDYYNKISTSSISPVEFRRNIITKGIRLNALVGKEFFIGKIKVKGLELCRPCKHLEELLNQKNLIKKMLLKSGFRCEILTNGKIYINDEITY